jgi:hypothetical protein
MLLPGSLLRLWVFLYIHAKIPRFTGCLCSLSGIKIHFREFLYNLCAKRNKLLEAQAQHFTGSLPSLYRNLTIPV